MGRHCKIVVLPEDACHADFARGFLKGRNVDERAYQLQRRWTGENGNNAAVLRWLCEEIRLRNKPKSPRYGILALIDEDGQGLETRRTAARAALSEFALPDIDPDKGTCLLVPMRNIETWMIWGKRWKISGASASPVTPATFEAVSEEHDYKRMKNISGQPLPLEAKIEAYDLGKILSQLNPTSPPTGTPPALRAALQPLNAFLSWCQIA